jgi:hypothetical protein
VPDVLVTDAAGLRALTASGNRGIIRGWFSNWFRRPTARLNSVFGKEMQMRFGFASAMLIAWRILRQLGWSCQRPTGRALERDQEAIRYWQRVAWPQLKKALCERRTIVFIDESGLSERPHRVHTWAPRGQTRVLQYYFNWKVLSVIAGITWRNFCAPG